MSIDRLHADAVCALGLYLRGNEKTDRAQALRTHEGAVDALAAEASRMVRERDTEIVRLRSALAAASRDLAGGDARAVMVRTGIDIVLAPVTP